MKRYTRSRIGRPFGLPQSAFQTTSGDGNSQKAAAVARGTGEHSNPETIPVSIIIPAYNEQAGVASQVNSVQEVMQSYGITHEIIVVDDGSEDATAEKAIEAGARVLRKPENQGYGAAIKTGILAAKHDTLVIIDADGTYPADQIPDLVRKLDAADMVVGARTGDNVHIPWVRRPAKWLLGLMAKRLSGQSIPDLNSGLRTFRRDCVTQYFSILSNKFSFTTTVTLALLADDYRVVYHPINYYERIGRSKIRPRNFIDFAILVLRMAMLFQPLKIFAPLAFLCILLGAIKTIADLATVLSRAPVWDLSLFQHPMLSVSATLLLLVGLQILLIGMMADGVLRRIGQGNRDLAPSHAVLSHELPGNFYQHKNAPESAESRV